MPTVYTIMATIIVPADKKAAADNFQAQVKGEALSSDPDGRPFGMKLNATGTGDPTHYALNSAFTDVEMGQWQAAVNLGTYGDTYYYAYDNLDYKLGATNDVSAQARLNEVWNWGKALQSRGLQTIQPPDDV